MELDLSTVETDVETLIDTALAAIPGNPIVLAPLERAAVHAMLTGVIHLVDAKLQANAPNSVYPSVARPAETASQPTWLQKFGAKLEGIFASVKVPQQAAAAPAPAAPPPATSVHPSTIALVNAVSAAVPPPAGA